jgi:hypothetical protein
VVPSLRTTLEDPLIGMVLTESVSYAAVSGLTSMSPTPVPRRPTLLLGLLPAVALLALAMGVATLFVGWELLTAGRAEPEPESATVARDEAPPPPEPESVQVLAVAPPAEPAAREPARAPAPPAAPATVGVDVSSSVPAEIWIDGKPVGSAVRGRSLTVGKHRIRLQSADGRAVDATVLIGGRYGATRFDWDGGPTLGAR